MLKRPIALAGAMSLWVSLSALAEQSAEELAKQLSNPVASLISLPLQYNADFDIGSENGTKQVLNVQPVIPVGLGKDWNLINRAIVPLVYQEDVSGNSGSQYGLGDTTFEFFFSPKRPTAGGWIFGFGPALLAPTGTDRLLGSEKWGAGPTALALRQHNGWTVGMLVNHIWSIAGTSARSEISSTFLQPFLAKQFSGVNTVTLNAESTYDWINAKWNVPVNLTYSRVTKIGAQRLSWAGGVRYFVETPGEGPTWGVRLVVTFLFPER